MVYSNNILQCTHRMLQAVEISNQVFQVDTLGMYKVWCDENYEAAKLCPNHFGWDEQNNTIYIPYVKQTHDVTDLVEIDVYTQKGRMKATITNGSVQY